MAGRPTKFRPEYTFQAGKLALLGATDQQIADFFGVSEQTLNSWKKKHPEFLESLNTNKEIWDDQIEHSLAHRAKGYSHPSEKIFLSKSGKVIRVPTVEHYPPDPTSCIFWLKNRRKEKWRDKIEHEHSGNDAAPIVLRWRERE